MRVTTAERPAGSRRMLLGFRGDRWDLRRSRCEPQAPTRNDQSASCKAAQGQSAGWAGKALCGWRPRDLSWKLPWEAEVEGSLGSWPASLAKLSSSKFSDRSHGTPTSSLHTHVHECTHRGKGAPLQRPGVHMCAETEWRATISSTCGRRRWPVSYSRRIGTMHVTATTEDSKLSVFKCFALSLEEMKNAAIILWS